MREISWDDPRERAIVFDTTARSRAAGSISSRYIIMYNLIWIPVMEHVSNSIQYIRAISATASWNGKSTADKGGWAREERRGEREKNEREEGRERKRGMNSPACERASRFVLYRSDVPIKAKLSSVLYVYIHTYTRIHTYIHVFINFRHLRVFPLKINLL